MAHKLHGPLADMLRYFRWSKAPNFVRALGAPTEFYCHVMLPCKACPMYKHRGPQCLAPGREELRAVFSSGRHNYLVWAELNGARVLEEPSK